MKKRSLGRCQKWWTLTWLELLAFFLEYIQCSNLISTSCLKWFIHSHCWLLHLNYVIYYFFLRNSHYYNNLIVFLKLLELARSNWCQIDVTWGQLWDHKRSKLILTWNTVLTNEIIVHVKSVETEFYHEILWEFFFLMQFSGWKLHSSGVIRFKNFSSREIFAKMIECESTVVKVFFGQFKTRLWLGWFSSFQTLFLEISLDLPRAWRKSRKHPSQAQVKLSSRFFY